MASAKPFLVTLTSAVLALSALAACGSGSDDEQSGATDDSSLEAQAKQEGELTWYTSTDPSIAQRAADGFEKTYDIKVDVYRAVSSELQQRYLSEASAGKPVADVINTGTPQFFDDALSKGILKPLTPEVVPGLDDYPAESVKDSSIVLGATPFNVGYNTDLVSEDELPKTWEEWIQNNVQDTLILDPRNNPTYLAFFHTLQQELGDDFMTKFADHKLQLIASSVPAIQQLAAGQAKFVLPTQDVFVEPIQSKGAPVATYVISPTTGSEQYLGLSTDAPHPSAARLFVQWMTSPEAQQLFNGDTSVSPLENLSGNGELPEGYVRPDVVGAVDNIAHVLGLMGLR